MEYDFLYVSTFYNVIYKNIKRAHITYQCLVLSTSLRIWYLDALFAQFTPHVFIFQTTGVPHR